MDLKHVAERCCIWRIFRLDANVQFMTVMATKMPLIGRG